MKCPKCKEEIDYLNNWVSGDKRYRFDGKDYEGEDFVENYKVNEYECPECSETLAFSEEEAIKLLKEEK